MAAYLPCNSTTYRRHPSFRTSGPRGTRGPGSSPGQSPDRVRDRSGILTRTRSPLLGRRRVGSFGPRYNCKIPDPGASRLVGDDGRGVGCRRRRKRRGREERSFATSGWRRKRPAGFARYPLRPILPLSSSPPPNIHHAYAPQSSVIPGEQTTRFARPGILKTRGEGIGRSNLRRATAVCRSARSTQPRHEKIPDLGASRLVGDDGRRGEG